MTATLEELKVAQIFAPPEYWVVGEEVRKEICGGCGAGKVGDLFVPDTLYGLRVTAICGIHDWMYYHGETIDDKDQADRVLLNNLLRWVTHHTKNPLLHYLRSSRALKYYAAVQAFGGPAFWNGKN